MLLLLPRSQSQLSYQAKGSHRHGLELGRLALADWGREDLADLGGLARPAEDRLASG